MRSIAGTPGAVPLVSEERRPYPVKRYPGSARFRLDPRVPLALGDVRAAFAGPSHDAGDAGGTGAGAAILDAARLSALLYYASGYVWAEAGPDGTLPHRAVPSARRAYPTELYVHLPRALPAGSRPEPPRPGEPGTEPPRPGGAGMEPPRPGGADGGAAVPAGLYYADPVHHALLTIAGPGTGTGTELVVTARFWKVAYRYGDYAYRLCAQEAGIVAGAVLAVARALGLGGEIRYLFDDGAVNDRLGLDPREEAAFAVIALGAAGAGGGGAWRDGGAGLAGIGSPSPLDERACAAFLDLDRRARIAGRTSPAAPPPAAGQGPRGRPVVPPPGPPRVPPPGPPSVPPPGPPRVPPPDQPSVPPPGPARVPPAGMDLAAAVRARDSGPLWFTPGGDRVPAGALALTWRYALAPYPSDAAPPGEVAAGLIVTVNRVDGVAPGVYRVLPGGAVGVVRSGDVAPVLDAARPPSLVVNVDTCGYLVTVVGDPDAAGAALGDRGYRVLTMEAGVIAYRCCLLAAACGLSARPYNTYDAQALGPALGLAGSGLLPLFQIAVGRPRALARPRLPMHL